MKIEKHLDWENPTIYYKEKAFELEISKDEIEITCQWDHGYGGRGTEIIRIPLTAIEGLINEIKKV